MNTATAQRPRETVATSPLSGTQVVSGAGPAAPAQRVLGIGEQLKARSSQFQAALPAHIPLERFMRVVMTAIQRNADLAQADRTSLFTSAVQAAQDGLLPDGREGALVIYNSKIKEGGQEKWVKLVQWMPMIAGIRKKVRNSGEIAIWEVQVVHANDKFEFELGDDPFIKHRPCMDGDPGPVIAAYSVATLKSGEKSREVMTKAQIEKVRLASKSKDRGPWVDWYEEMCRKAVARRHSKVLPMSTDLDDVIRRDDELYDMKGAREEAVAANGGKPQSLAGKLDVLAQMPTRENAPLVDRGPAADASHDPKTGEVATEASDDTADAPTAPDDAEDAAIQATPREKLIHNLRGAIMRGENALKLLNGLSPEEAALLTKEDKDQLNDAWKAFSKQGSAA